jgi:hypothetical protein
MIHSCREVFTGPLSSNKRGADPQRKPLCYFFVSSGMCLSNRCLAITIPTIRCRVVLEPSVPGIWFVSQMGRALNWEKYVEIRAGDQPLVRWRVYCLLMIYHNLRNCESSQIRFKFPVCQDASFPVCVRKVTLLFIQLCVHLVIIHRLVYIWNTTFRRMDSVSCLHVEPTQLGSIDRASPIPGQRLHLKTETGASLRNVCYK